MLNQPLPLCWQMPAIMTSHNLELWRRAAEFWAPYVGIWSGVRVESKVSMVREGVPSNVVEVDFRARKVPSCAK